MQESGREGGKEGVEEDGKESGKYLSFRSVKLKMMATKDPWMIKILKYLMDEGIAHTAQVARGVHIATTTAHKYLENMVGEGLVVANRLGVGKPVYWTVKKADKAKKLVIDKTVRKTVDAVRKQRASAVKED